MTHLSAVRPLERRDIPDLIQLCREHAAYERSEWSEYEREPQLAARLLDSDDAWCFVVDDGTRLGGFITVFREYSTWDAGSYLHLDCMYLRPEVRGIGLGRQLLAAAARIATEAKAINLQWQTPEWNDDAIGFYRHLGGTTQSKVRFRMAIETCRELGASVPGVVHVDPRGAGKSPSGFDPAELERGLNGAARMIRSFYDGLDDRPVSPNTPTEDVIDMVRGSLGEDGVGIDSVLQEVETKLIPQSMAIPHPLYLGLINSSPLPGGIIADSLIAALNNNAGAWEQSPAFSAAEHEVIRCLAEMLGLPGTTEGIVLPGGSFATLHGLQLAREHQLPQWRTDGIRSLSGNPRIYTSDATHFSAARAAGVLGIAPRDAIAIPSTGRGSMDVAALAEAIRHDRAQGHLPFAVVATVGTTGSGASDSLSEIAAVCREHGIWMHADVCYGGAAALLDECRDLFDGIEQADSVAIDPHKWFFVPLVAGVLLTRHRGLGEDVFDIDASYIPTGSRVDAFRRAFPTSRRAAGFAIWMAIRAHGLAFIRDAVRQNNTLMRRMEDKLREAGFRVMDDGRLSISCARWELPNASPEKNDALQTQIANAIVKSGDAWFGTVRAQGQLWLRFALVSMHTEEHHIDNCVERLTHVARSLTTA